MPGLNKRIIIFIITIMFLLLVQHIVAAESDYSWINNIYFMEDNYELANYTLNLPESNLKSFSPRAQEELLNFASQFGGNVGSELDAQGKDTVDTLNSTISDIKLEDNDQDYLKYEPSPDVKVKADYGQEKEDMKIKRNTRVDLEYYMNQRTLIRAGYSLVSKEWPDIKMIEDNSSEETATDNSDQGANSGDLENSNDNDVVDSTSKDSKPVLIINNQENKQEGRVGISYQTTDKITISADYIKEDLFSEEDDFSTVFGVEYTDEIGKLRAKYLIDSGENQETGLELDLKDLATLSASYKILDPDLIEEQLNKESVWDFGIDFNLSDLSSVSIGYQLIDNKNQSSDSSSFENFNIKESNIEASFEIKF